MKAEIDAAAQFLTQLISQNQPRNIPDDCLNTFRNCLVKLLVENFQVKFLSWIYSVYVLILLAPWHLCQQGHWFPANPNRGQAYRCIRLNGNSCADPIISRAASEVGLKYSELKLPVELTLWVDPLEVSCRYYLLQCKMFIIVILNSFLYFQVWRKWRFLLYSCFFSQW